MGGKNLKNQHIHFFFWVFEFSKQCNKTRWQYMFRMPMATLIPLRWKQSWNSSYHSVKFLLKFEPKLLSFLSQNHGGTMRIWQRSSIGDLFIWILQIINCLRMDSNQDGMITYDEFVQCVKTSGDSDLYRWMLLTNKNFSQIHRAGSACRVRITFLI